ncbi:uncharacterized protein LOC125373047 [Haliotis rufescens]|uniref:uncharacterized protein LOC125373047 n=1 Tax=Haliotis rufescens TaxID=6454 RepID=UPI00201F7902|nr:uncharacterized protein LOC125373047 [Haliotis rufescens]
MPRNTKRGGSPVTVRSKTMKTRGAGRKRRRVEEREDLTAKHSKQSEDIRPIVGPSDSMAPTAGNPSGAPGPSTSDSGTIRHEVWIIGSSYVYWSHRRALKLHLGKNLRLDSANITWFGIRGMHWSGLLPLLRKKLQYLQSPDTLVIHLGSNDLVTMRSIDLGRDIEQDMHTITDLLPNVQLIWSEMFPRRAWRGAESLAAIERKRKRVNRKAIEPVTKLKGLFVRHDIVARDSGLYREDDIHLSEIGNSIFVHELQEALFQAIPSAAL